MLCILSLFFRTLTLAVQIDSLDSLATTSSQNVAITRLNTALKSPNNTEALSFRCQSQCKTTCDAKWYSITTCYKTSWGCFQGCHMSCMGDDSCANKCMARHEWNRCKKESCKLGCLYGASVEMRFPEVTEMQSGPAGK